MRSNFLNKIAMKITMQKTLVLALLALLTLGITSCGGKMSKKEYKAQLETATADLNAIINGTTEWSLADQQARINAIKAMEFKEKDRNTINDLIERAEAVVKEKMDAQKAEEARKAEEERLRQAELERQRASQGPQTIDEYMTAIAKANDVNKANSLINKALGLFASPDVPVLIIISVYGNNNYDYDRPTTAAAYLNYLKDQRKVNARIHNVVRNEAGKITELELIK